jgi:hypothetical protein
MTKSKPTKAAQETAPKMTAPKMTQNTKPAEPSNSTPSDAETTATVSAASSAPESEAPAAQPETPAPKPAPEPELLRLPRGAFIAFRQRGRAEFATREMVLYPDGRVAYDARGVSQKEYNRLRRALNDGQVLALRKLLDQTNFWHAESVERQNPDAFVYEIAARLGQRANSIQVFEGSVPEKLEPLLERLTLLLPQE